MTLVYSSQQTEIKGVYCNPHYFKDANKKAKLVFTDNENIKNAYEALDIEVKPLPNKDEDIQIKEWTYPNIENGLIEHWAFPKEVLTKAGKIKKSNETEADLIIKDFGDSVLIDSDWKELYPNEDIELFRITEDVK